MTYTITYTVIISNTNDPNINIGFRDTRTFSDRWEAEGFKNAIEKLGYEYTWTAEKVK